MKYCYYCKSDKPFEDFHKNRSHKSGYRSECKSCCKEIQAKRYKKHISIVSRYKVMKGCQHCGYKGHPAALTLDHIDPATKTKNIHSSGAALHYLSAWSKIKEEVSKCQVLCANCHNIKTYKERR